MSEATNHITVAQDDCWITCLDDSCHECVEGSGPLSHCTRDVSAVATFNAEGTIAVVGSLSRSSPHGPSQYVFGDKDDLNAPSEGLNTPPYTLYNHRTMPVRLARDDGTLNIKGLKITTSTTRAGASHAVVEISQSHVPEIIGGTIGGAVGMIIVLAALFYYRRRKIRLAAGYSMGPLQASLPMSKEAFTSRKYGNYGLSFISSPQQSTDSLTTLPQKSPRQPRKNHMVSITAPEAV